MVTRLVASGGAAATVKGMHEWLTPAEAAKVARISKATLYRYWALGTGTGPRYSQVRNHRLVRRDWLDDWLTAQEAA